MVMAAVLGGAFAGGLADRMKENREYTKTKSDEMQAFLVQTGLKRRNEVAKARKGLTEAVDYLGSKGLEESNLLALLDQNPKEVIRLYSAALKAEARGDLTSTLLNQAVIASEGYTAPDMTPSELIKTATPDFIQGADLKKPEEREGSALNKMFRSPDIEEIMYDAYSSDVMGVKGKDIQASMTADLLKSGTEGPARASVDIGTLAEQDDYTSTDFREIKSQVEGMYDQAYANITDTALDLLKDVSQNADNTEVLELGGEQYTVGELRKISDVKIKIDKLKREGKTFEAYQEIMKLDPSIAQALIAQGGIRAQVFTSPFGFGFSQTYMEDLIGGN